MNQSILVKGNLKLIVKDAFTNKILKIDEGDNLVLNTGLTSLCHLITGDIPVPKDLVPGELLSNTRLANEHLPFYGQFGTNPTVPRATDISPHFNGTLDPNIVTPYEASDIIKTKHFYSSDNSVTVQFLLPSNKGNGHEEIIYKEAVLMCKVTDSPPKYKWFARRVFGDIIKNHSTIIEAEWTFTFTAG